MQDNHPLWHPTYWLTWFAVGLCFLLGKLPYRLQMWLGSQLGALAWYLVPGRRRVAAINLKLCFPEKSAAERARLVRAHFRSLGMGAMETLICWWGPQRKIEQLTDLEGLRHLETAAEQGQGMILYSAHFTSLELGVRMAQIHLKRLGIVTTAMYKPPHNRVIDHVMQTRREKHIGEASISYKDVRGLIRALRSGRAVWYASDQKARQKGSVTVPFFGVPARCHVATGQIAKLTGAPIVPFFTLRRKDNRGYRLVVLPPLDNFPSGDDAADAIRLNQLIEPVIRQAPDQYFWIHKRFERDDHNPYAKT